MNRILVLGMAALALSACGPSDRPGALEGTWLAREPFPVKVAFRQGEMEAMGTTRRVSYETRGDDVLVTYLEGPAKGRTFRYTVVDGDTLRSESGTFHRSP